MCTRQRPVGREEGINFTLERRSNCHLRICGGISIFPLLSSRWSVKGKISYLFWRLWAVLVTKESTFPLPETLEVKLKSVILPTQCPRTDLLFCLVYTLPAALVQQQSITYGLTAFDWHPQLIDVFGSVFAPTMLTSRWSSASQNQVLSLLWL